MDAKPTATIRCYLKGKAFMKKVMIIDDDQSAISGLIEHVHWGKLNLEVQDTAKNGEEALEKVKMDPPDILITDIYMPKMDGLTLIKTLHERFPSIYIIIHSGYNHFDNARKAIRYGVKHFFLKPSTIQEIESVLHEIAQDMEVQKKQEILLERYNKQLKEYLVYTKNALIRELLNEQYSSSEISSEKLELLQLSKDSNVIVAIVSLIRPPYLTKSKEREWQLMKFSSGNIIKEIIDEESGSAQTEVHVVDYSDSDFVLVFSAEDKIGPDLQAISRKITKKIVDSILLYLKISLNAGIGEAKKGIQQICNSYLESQRALEAAEYQEMNKVFTFEAVHGQGNGESYKYPLDVLKDIHAAIRQKEIDKLLEIWIQFEQDLLTEQKMPLFIVQNICISTINAFAIDEYSYLQLSKDTQTVANMVTKIYSQPSTKELCFWMRRQLHEWRDKFREEWTGQESNKLIREVKEYVQNYYDEEITLAEIADSLYVNRNYLSQLFKKVTGETFVTYLNKFRIERAKEKLREQHYMVYEVSEMVGYQNPTYFSQVFKSITGVSPSDFYSLR